MVFVEVNLLFVSNATLASEDFKEYERMLQDAGGNLGVASRRFIAGVDAEFPKDEEMHATGPEQVKAAQQIEVSSISSIGEVRLKMRKEDRGR